MDHEMHRDEEQAIRAPEGVALYLTDVAVEKVKEVLAREGLKDGGLRVSVVGGGCSGFQYNLGLDESPREDDTVIEQDGVRLFLDPISQQYVYGTVIDYVNGLHGAGFKFVNPNANRTCGCGSSFAV
ncbi:MAG TPA: iron-sulfur cluster insertion protein ErpA [Methylomirabilota bacterium]|jgi:iron-sulfur cluster insertion protein|nr:iron-sulfur cluster insertion protein ErpA [Methylomirabilota bacterium]